MLFVFILLAVTVVLFLSDRLRLDVVALLVILALMISGTLTPAEAVAGFGNTTVLLIAGLFVVGEGLSRTGVASAMGAWLVRSSGGSSTALQIRLMLVIAVLSAFMSSTGAVAIFIPVAASLARKTGTPVSRLMMPMAFAALIGGTLTLIGTPPNIVVSEELAAKGFAPFEFFSFSPIGIVLLAVGILYMMTLGKKLLPTTSVNESQGGDGGHSIDDLIERYGQKGRLFMVEVLAGSPLCGITLSESELAGRARLQVLGVQREDRFGRWPALSAGPDSVPRARDQLLVHAQQGFDPYLHLAAFGLRKLERSADRAALDNELGVVEVVVPPRSTLRGKTVRENGLGQILDLQVVGVLSGGEAPQGDPLDHDLKLGDTLLLGGSWPRIETLYEGYRELLVMEVPKEWNEVAPAYPRAYGSLLILGLMLLTMVMGWAPATTAVLGAATAMVLIRCLSMPQAYRAMNWQSLVLIAGMLPMATALEKTGGLEFLVDGMTGATNLMGSYGVMALFFLVTALFSQFISNTATTVLIAPVAIGVAQQAGISPYPLLMSVAFAASAAFVTPVASPVNTLVLGPGGYRFGDFARVGLPLLFLTLCVVLLVVPIFFPF